MTEQDTPASQDAEILRLRVGIRELAGECDGTAAEAEREGDKRNSRAFKAVANMLRALLKD